MRYPLVSRAAQILANRERLAFSDPLFLASLAFLRVFRLSSLLFLSVRSWLAHGGTWPRWCFPMELPAVFVYV